MDEEKVTKILDKDIPQKVVAKILAFVPQSERQSNRLVSHAWDLIVKDIPVELFITNTNYEKLFKCGTAKKVTITNLTTEYNGDIHFQDTVKTLILTGKVLSSNVIKLLSTCQELETLVSQAPREVLGIENSELFGHPKLKTLEFKVRMDQDTFTSDEMILINSLRNIKLSSLERVIISVTLSWFYDDEFDDGLSSMQQSMPFGSTMSEFADDSPSGAVQLRSRPFAVGQHIAIGPLLDDTEEMNEGDLDIDSSVTDTDMDMGAVITTATAPEQSQENAMAVAIEDNPEEIPARVDVSVGMTESSSRYSRLDLAQYEFASRLFATRLMLWSRQSPTDLDSFLNDTGPATAHYGIGPLARNVAGAGVGPQTITELKSTSFFELLKNNSDKLKAFIVKARPDFLCFGSIGSFPKEAFSKIQLEDVEYSFGRSRRLCSEHLVLEQQRELRSMKLQILDDLWPSIMIAAEKSQNTLVEMDVKVLSLSEEPIDLLPLSKCQKLDVLKLFHFFDKKNISTLPPSVTKLVINGPVSKDDLTGLTTSLPNLTHFDLILNWKATDKIDVPLFTKLVSMPKIEKLIFIQTQIDVDGITKEYGSNPTIQLTVQGPRVLREPYTLTSQIQIVAVSITRPS